MINMKGSFGATSIVQWVGHFCWQIANPCSISGSTPGRLGQLVVIVEFKAMNKNWAPLSLVEKQTK